MKAKAAFHMGLTVVFDLDGTLADTAGDLIATTNVILNSLNLQPLDLETARPLIGNGARALIEAGLKANHFVYDDTRLALLTERFLEYYSEHIADFSTVRSGLFDLLDSFIERHFTLAVCTNKRTPLAKQLMKKLTLDRYFGTIIGSGELPFSKPDRRMLDIAISEAGGFNAQSVLIGDSITDVETARAAAVPVILVDFGYTAIPARELGADSVISEWDELMPLLDARFSL